MLVQAADAQRDYIAGETLALELLLGENAVAAQSSMEHSAQAHIDGLPLSIALHRAAR